MKNVYEGATKTGKPQVPASCTDSPQEESCCGLECLTRPRFFCGQLLTAQDLEALVGWTRSKFRLKRYLQGWGVVCGLEVRCDPGCGSRIIVSPGYAVGCCGEDIIVCEDCVLDLSEACQPKKDPCLEIKPVKNSQTEIGATAKEPEYVAVDLYIRYKEEHTDSQLVPGRSACRETSACEPTRTREGFSLCWQTVALRSDPQTAKVLAWLTEYYQCTQVVASFLRSFPEYSKKTTSREVQKWLLDWIEGNPLRQFCFLREEICLMDENEWRKKVPEILFYIVHDCRTAFLACHCFDCLGNTGVPLARVYLKQSANTSCAERCRVAGIDSFPPFRRAIGGDCYPARLGEINLGGLIGHRLEEACMVLAKLGFKVKTQSWDFPMEISALIQEFNQTSDHLLVPLQDTSGGSDKRVITIYHSKLKLFPGDLVVMFRM